MASFCPGFSNTDTLAGTAEAGMTCSSSMGCFEGCMIGVCMDEAHPIFPLR